MPHRLMWLELAEQQYLNLPSTQPDAIDACLARLTDNAADAPHATYDNRTDQWSVPIGEQGLLLYAVVAQPPTVIVLRLIVDAT